MRLKTPRFWYEKTLRGRIITFFLLPFSFLYYLAHRIHQARGKPWRASIPVLCVGNLVAGGGGKTPTAVALMSMIREHNLAKNPCFLSRGYGGSSRGALQVDPLLHDAALVGDEPLLLARFAPTIVSADRAAGARLAEQSGFDLIIMDDGLQNQTLAHDLNFLCMDATNSFGNGHLLPAGPLRQPLKAGLKNVDAIILIGPSYTQSSYDFQNKPIFQAYLQPLVIRNLDLNIPYLAFTGLARPEKFYRTLIDLNINLRNMRTFPDHYRYKTADLTTLEQEANAFGAILLTTEKDAARLPPNFIKQTPVKILPIELQWQTPEHLLVFLQKNLQSVPS